MTDTTFTYTTTLQATAIPSHTVAFPTPFPLGTLNLVLTVDFMLVDPATNSLPLMLKCFTRRRQHLKPCKGGSCLPIQAVGIHIWTRFRRLPKESVLMEVFVSIKQQKILLINTFKKIVLISIRRSIRSQ